MKSLLLHAARAPAWLWNPLRRHVAVYGYQQCRGYVLKKLALKAIAKKDLVEELMGRHVTLGDETAEDLRVPEDWPLNDAIFAMAQGADPFSMVGEDLAQLRSSILAILGSDHPVLSKVAKYLFMQEGKLFRPVVVMLMSRALSAYRGSNGAEGDVTQKQHRLAEIAELIHTASLLHDDVIDVADTRRGVSSVNQLFGNKMAVLAGDFLLARASVSISRLRNAEVIELLSHVIEHLVKGEIMQVTAPDASWFDAYLQKTFYKTSSLVANSLLSTAKLIDADERAQEVAYLYGRHLGMAFQLVDDVLDYTGTSKMLGKPAASDMRAGVVTAPVLYAQEEFPELGELIERKFGGKGDADKALHCVGRSQGIARTQRLALTHAQIAAELVRKNLADVPAVRGLVALAHRVVNRLR